MGAKSWVRVARCQLLVSCLFTMVLAVGCCILVVITGLGSHFTIFTKASSADNMIKNLHYTMVLYGGFVCGLLILTLLLSTFAVIRESQHLMATAFVGFGFLFCALMVGLTWTQECQTRVESSILDVYDDLYEQVLRGYPGEAQEHLLQAHNIFQCCGKNWTRQTISTPHIVCSNTADDKIYGLVLSSFLYFSLPRGNNWERRGEYSLNGGLVSTPDTPLIQLVPYQSAQ
ncbi:tetraspanin-32 isoform 2-T2 [Anomaloglossus baeobatrachus]